ncbi:MAG: hypothetical protein EXR71_14340 [Myxococcales bacterium]|nr:hypothetical protein [Myxococcales bacterium]
MRTLPVLCLLAFACVPEEKEEDSAGTLNPAEQETTCSGTAPVVDDFSAAEGEPIEDNDGGGLQASVLLLVDYSDEDGDAHILRVDVWWDTVIDGTVDVSGSPNAATPPTALEDAGGTPVEECAGKGGTFGLSVGVTGDDLDYETEYDFGVVIYDASDTPSEPAFATGVTPAIL